MLPSQPPRASPVTFVRPSPFWRTLLSFILLVGSTADCSRGALARSREGESPERLSTPVTCGDEFLPPGWPDQSSEEGQALLAPFLRCASPTDFIALQQRVDMSRLVERLDDWDAVRLSALGPVRSDAVPALTRKRASFILRATERYGFVYAEVPVLFLLHSAHDDELRELVRLLARDKQLEQTLGPMPTVCGELARRGLPLTDFPERPEQARDVLRGLGRATRDALATSPMSDGARGMEFEALRAQLPPLYQQALHAVDEARLRQHYSPEHVALGTFDSLTFGVPLGFYSLVVGTGHGAYALTQGQYEQATRELAPAVLLVALYAGGKVGPVVSTLRESPGGASGLLGPGARLRALRDVARHLEERLGMQGLRELAREIQTSQEAGRFVALGGPDAALALHEARGDVARAQVWLSQARPEGMGSSLAGGLIGEGSGVLASVVDAAAGLTPEVVEVKLAQQELAAEGPRLSANVTVLERLRPSLKIPPPGAEESPRWGVYVAYWERRLGELREGKAVEGPLRWEAYERMWGGFTRGLVFERAMMQRLRADAALPRAQRRFLGDFELPRVEAYVGVWKPKTGLRFADVLVIEQRPSPEGMSPRVETFSFKSRNLSGLEEKFLQAQMRTDAGEALGYYGEALAIRRPSLKPLVRDEGKVSVSRVRLIYEGNILKPQMADIFDKVVDRTKHAVPGVEVLLQ